MNKFKKKKCIAVFLSVIIMASVGINGVGFSDTYFFIPRSKAETYQKLSNPDVKLLKRDLIQFGSYWQEEYSPHETINNPTDGMEYTDSDGTKMLYMSQKYFKKSPIEWQVLAKEDSDGDGEEDTLLLLADHVLDSKRYNETDDSVSWENCTVREWLNNDFYNAAFTDDEKKAIKESEICNEICNPYTFSVEKSDSTTDFLFLLSCDDVTNTEYGFLSLERNRDQARLSVSTEYAQEKGCEKDSSYETSEWWLRTPGKSGSYAKTVNSCCDIDEFGRNVNYDARWNGVRPALRVSINKSCISAALEEKEQKTMGVLDASWSQLEFGTYNGDKILWRVLSVEDDEVLLLSEKIIETVGYTKNSTDPVEWKSSSIREWLNNDFYNEAFTEEEKKVLKEKTLNNGDDDATNDYIYLLSYEDMLNTDYGFSDVPWCSSAARKTEIKGAEFRVGDSKNYYCWWWLRTPTSQKNTAMGVDYDGIVGVPNLVVRFEYCDGIRPALCIKLSAWKKMMGISDQAEEPPKNPSSDTKEDMSEKDTQINTTIGTTNTVSDNKESESSAQTSAAPKENTEMASPSKVTSLKVKNNKKGKTSINFKKISGVTGYQIQYARNKKFSKNKKTVTTKKTSYTIKKLKKKKTYYFRVRAYIKNSSGKKIFGQWSAVQKLKIKK